MNAACGCDVRHAFWLDSGGRLSVTKCRHNALRGSFSAGPRRLGDGFEARRFLMKCFGKEALFLCVLNLDNAIFGIVEQRAKRVDVGPANQAFNGNEFSE